MKVFCLKYPRNTITDILICLLCVFVILLILINADADYVQVSADTDIITNFLDSNGWIVNEKLLSVNDKLIPDKSDDVNCEYFSLQEYQGFSLDEFIGRHVKQYSYPLLNYPGYENMQDIYINLLLYNDKIIGADICCVSINGFITGAVRNGKNSS